MTPPNKAELLRLCERTIEDPCHPDMYELARALKSLLTEYREGCVDESHRRMVHDFPRLIDFYSTHAFTDKVEPSCLKCGRQRYDRATIKHMVLKNIYLCDECAAPQVSAQPVQAAPVHTHQHATELMIVGPGWHDRIKLIAPTTCVDGLLVCHTGRLVDDALEEEVRRGEVEAHPPAPQGETQPATQEGHVVWDERSGEPPREVWVVSSKLGPDFVAVHKMMADDHANECAAELPEEGPYRVCKYVAEPFAQPSPSVEPTKTESALHNGDNDKQALHNVGDTPTPRTDALQNSFVEDRASLLAHARQLERELTAANQELHKRCACEVDREAEETSLKVECKYHGMLRESLERQSKPESELVELATRLAHEAGIAMGYADSQHPQDDADYWVEGGRDEVHDEIIKNTILDAVALTTQPKVAASGREAIALLKKLLGDWDNSELWKQARELVRSSDTLK